MEESPTKSCPKCGKRNDAAAIECQRCGIIFEKYEQIQKRKTERYSSNAHSNLQKCKDCGGTISKNAETCPHCGAKGPKANQYRPSTSKKNASAFQTIAAVIILSVIVFAALSIFFKSGSSKSNTTQSAVNRELTEAEKEQRRIERDRKKAEEYELCKKDLKCWAEKHDSKAYIKSREIIEKHAKYQFEWTDGWLDPKLTHFRWHNKSRLTVTYLGDKIKFQNGFGAWQNMIYQIDYDPLNEKLLNVSLRPGRL